MSGPGFVHLHVHSAYSLLEGALPFARLLSLAAGDKQPALGIADSANLFGALEFSEKCAAKGIQPIIGCEIPLDFEAEDEIPADRAGFGKSSVVLIACDEQGFSNLSTLISRAYLENEDGVAVLHRSWLNGQNTSGIICLSGGPEGAIDPLFAAGLNQHAQDRLDDLHSLFGDRLYIELQRHGMESEARVEPYLVEYAYANDIALVATNEPYFPAQSDYEAHDALLAIAQGSVLAQTKRRKLTDQHYFKSRAEMARLFADLPEALASTVQIARRISFRPLTRAPILPSFSLDKKATPKQALANEADELSRQARAGLERRLKKTGLAGGYTRKDYDERLEFELKIIAGMKYPGYFLIVADFIKWAKSQNIPVGPGRGSGAGSLVAYVLTITDLDPLKYQLLFERFLNPERVSMPDFDIDFCQERREEVIHYVQQKYGREQVAQIITFGSLQARAALRDVGRVLQMPYGQVDRICKLVPSNPAAPVSIAQALKEVRELRNLRDEDETVSELLQIAQNLEGLYRHASTHAAGIVIGDRPLHEMVPLYRDPRSDMQVTQYSLKWVEPAGLVKFDFLGLKTLTVIDYAIKMINRNGTSLSVDNMAIDDRKTFDMLRAGDTVGVFQVESAGMRRALVDMQPDRFEDLIALVALFRPGPMENIPHYCARKLGHEEVEYLHPLLEPILKPTYGVITYQEQVQQIGRDLAGYTLAEADLLRRAMGKKIRAEMDAQRSRFVSGAGEKGIGDKIANKIFDACAKFAEYGFNKSHSAPYAFITYQTAFLKANHAREFLAASMTLDMANTDKLSDFKRDADRLKIEVVPPCVNRSEIAFDVKKGAIHYSLCAIKGVGRQVAEHIVGVRGHTPFADLADFASRIDPKNVNRRTLEALVNAGAFDCFVASREQASEAVETIIGTAQRATSNRIAGTTDMFEAEKPRPIALNADFVRWSIAERLEREHAAIGFHLSAHPLDEYGDIIKSQGVLRWLDFEQMIKNGKSASRLAGAVVARTDRRTKKGTPMAILTLSDPSGSFECLLFSEQIAKYGAILEQGMLAILDVEADKQSDGVHMRLLRARSIKAEAQQAERQLIIYATDKACLSPIAKLLKPGGNGTVSFRVNADGGAREYEIRLNGKYMLDADLAGGVKSIHGVNDVRLN
ncbi:DNA polymerase III alpha subunit [hydrothermal vent metagenome]|uniref:DNA-directed DNA polymerase n=1 Tax=hydrothermal vent metagenome TaxID=652676 RepID=A0A3B0TXV6_9ZZZZ